MFDGITADVILLGIGGRKDSEDLIKNIVLPLGAKTVIPIHYDNFFAPLNDQADHITGLIGVDANEFASTAGEYEEKFQVR